MFSGCQIEPKDVERKKYIEFNVNSIDTPKNHRFLSFFSLKKCMLDLAMIFFGDKTEKLSLSISS